MIVQESLLDPGFIDRPFKKWVCFVNLLLNIKYVFNGIKGTHFFLFVVTAAGLVWCGSPGRPKI